MSKQGMVFGAFVVACIGMTHGHPIGVAYFAVTIAHVVYTVRAESAARTVHVVCT
jgi:hypothetical protein